MLLPFLAVSMEALGMADLYKIDADTRNFIHKAAALPFIPPRFIRIAWTLVESEAPPDQ